MNDIFKIKAKNGSFVGERTVINKSLGNITHKSYMLNISNKKYLHTLIYFSKKNTLSFALVTIGENNLLTDADLISYILKGFKWK